MNADKRGSSRPDLSIVVLSWNVRELLRECLRSVVSAQESVVRRQLSGADHLAPGSWLLTPGSCPLSTELIVVDNASTDGSAEMVVAEFPETRLIRNAENLGYARANNIGIAVGAGRYVLLLNSDTVVPPGTLEALVAFMDAHPQAGACSPRLVQTDGRPQPYAFGGDPTPLYLLRRGINRLLLNRPLHDWAVAEPVQVDWVSGACLLARRAAIEQVGGLDEAMFMYFEDNDWCRRMRLAGWQVWYVPTVAITHIGGAGLKQNPAARRAYRESLRYFYRKHYGPAANLFLRLVLPVYGRLLRSD